MQKLPSTAIERRLDLMQKAPSTIIERCLDLKEMPPAKSVRKRLAGMRRATAIRKSERQP